MSSVYGKENFKGRIEGKLAWALEITSSDYLHNFLAARTGEFDELENGRMLVELFLAMRYYRSLTTVGEFNFSLWEVLYTEVLKMKEEQPVHMSYICSRFNKLCDEWEREHGMPYQGEE